jgi:hypothetical protein
LDDYQVVAAIGSFLDLDEGWDERSVHGWTATRRQAFEDTCRQILAWPSWDEQIAVGLASDDEATFWVAEEIARERGSDTFDVLLNRLRADAYDTGWFFAWRQADSRRAEQLVELARTSLPLDEVAGAPADEMGLRPGWEVHAALDWSLQALRRHPGIGADLLLIGLGSPVVRNRNMALMALKDWPRDTWPAAAPALITEIARRDPCEDTRELAAELPG